MNSEDNAEFCGASSGSVTTCTQLQHPMHFDTIPTSAMLDNVMYNNPRVMRICGLTMQPLPLFDQFPVLPSHSSQLLGSQFRMK